MSGFIGAAQPSFVAGLEDLRLNRPDFRAERLHDDGITAVAPADFSSPWWPRSGFAGDFAVDVAILAPTRWGQYDPAAGAASRYGFVGVTRDQYGTALGGVTVKLFRTSNDVLLDSTISDPSGNYLLNTPYYPDTHYIVAHKTGSPDLDGASVNTLIGT